ncbi:MAG: GntR family transcriptional regulator [Phycisphaeraceae bacterium]
MSTAPANPSRSKTSEQVTRLLRQRIVDGRWPSGFRLPTRRELEEELGVSTATIQKAMDVLVADGFIQTRGRAGTFVRHRLPHLTRIGLAVWKGLDLPYPHARFVHALRRAAEQIQPLAGVEVQHYYDVSIDPPSKSFHKLCDDIDHARIGGVLGLAIHWDEARQTPLMQNPHLARAAVSALPVQDVPRIRMEPYTDEVVASIAAQGRQRLAVIYHARERCPSEVDDNGNEWATALRKRNLAVHHSRLIPVHSGTPQTAAVVAHLLMDLPHEIRPDALVIADDHLVEATTNALARIGVRVPEDLLVYGHANLPDPPPSAVPMQWVGYHIPQVVEAGLALLRLQLTGANPAGEPVVIPRFEPALPSTVPGHASSNGKPVVSAEA